MELQSVPQPRRRRSSLHTRVKAPHIRALEAASRASIPTVNKHTVPHCARAVAVTANGTWPCRSDTLPFQFKAACNERYSQAGLTIKRRCRKTSGDPQLALEGSGGSCTSQRQAQRLPHLGTDRWPPLPSAAALVQRSSARPLSGRGRSTERRYTR